MSPNNLTVRALEADGWVVDLVERQIPGTFLKKDLFGMFDVLAVRAEETLAVQATSDTNVRARVKKLSDSEKIGAIRKAGWRIEVWGWKKRCDLAPARVVVCT